MLVGIGDSPKELEKVEIVVTLGVEKQNNIPQNCCGKIDFVSKRSTRSCYHVSYIFILHGGSLSL